MNIPVATSIKPKDEEAFEVMIRDGELYIPQVITDLENTSYFYYYIKINKNNLKELIDYYG